MRDPENRDVDDLIAKRRAANPRRTPDRAPVGAEQTRRLLRVTVAVVLAATLVLVVVVALGGS